MIRVAMLSKWHVHAKGYAKQFSENPNAERLYLSQGFKHVGERIFFDHKMHHLQRTKPR